MSSSLLISSNNVELISLAICLIPEERNINYEIKVKLKS